MQTLLRNPSIGSILLEAIDAGIVRQIFVRDSDIGHFQVDHGAHLFLVSARRNGRGWMATLSPSLLDALTNAFGRVETHGQQSLFGGPHLWIVCGGECCVLRPREWIQVVDLDAVADTQAIRIERPPNCSFRVRGPGGVLAHTIPLRRFPSRAVAA
ncbi:MAG: hypothetical protein GVY18_18080 [Bacteroidetes bacterium]|jgi:hypothetical protein|nr:hypothetical protein [Bacteroidota bacterium]